ncbi:keratin-associated protein 13-1-like [Psammomys obesus]|uniref:keratin-associated protein 13-1-like n=1 Tax=Psammomys obesus TaxID=48139 RepID=UPI0024534F17|nr:keratin-associated protein 13-1-like [Psammomys obesus]
MSYSCCSGSISSRSYGGQLHYPYSSCGSAYPRHLIQSTNFCSPRPCHLGSSLHSGCHQNCFQPIRCQTSQVVHSSCQRPCFSPRVSGFCSPCRTYAGSQGFGSSSCHSLGYGSRSYYTSGCSSRVFRPVNYGVRCYPSFGHGSRFCHPTYVTSTNFQSSCHRPTCGSAVWRANC